MRIVSAVAAIMLVTGTAHADPHKVDPQGAQPQKRAAPVVLASADTPQVTPNDVVQSAPPPAKRPIGRATHCRCGDPQPESQSPDR